MSKLFVTLLVSTYKRFEYGELALYKCIIIIVIIIIIIITNIIVVIAITIIIIAINVYEQISSFGTIFVRLSDD